MNEPAAAEHTAVSKPRLAVEAVLRTDVGLVRAENQDSGAFTSPREERDSHPGGRLLIVADGMGGHRGGATASKLAVETIKRQYLDSETTDVGDALRDALTRANARIFSEAQGNPELRGMGTTASVLVLKNNQAWLGHVGDSRIYRVRAAAVEQLTEDHSLVASMVREGLLTPKEAETHPRRNVLQRSMGVGEQVDIDVHGPFDVLEGDLFVLCSDGLHGLVRSEELGEIAALPLRQAADEYVKRALERGAPDNVTVIVARAIPADQLGDETLTDADMSTIRTSGIEETHRDTVPMPAPMERMASTPPATSAAPPAASVPLASAATLPRSPESGVTSPSGGGRPGDRTLETPVPATTAPLSAPTALPAVAPPDRTAAEDKKRGVPPSLAVASPPTSSPKVVAQKPAARSWMWILLTLFFAAGAAGAWFFWSQQQRTGSRPTTAPHSR